MTRVTVDLPLCPCEDGGSLVPCNVRVLAFARPAIIRADPFDSYPAEGLEWEVVACGPCHECGERRVEAAGVPYDPRYDDAILAACDEASP